MANLMAEIWPLNHTDWLDMWIQAKLKLKIRKTNLKGDTDLCSGLKLTSIGDDKEKI